MGSINTTCAISGLPIRNNHKVKVMFLRKNEGYKSDFYPTLHYCPLPILGSGIYDEESLGKDKISVPLELIEFIKLYYDIYNQENKNLIDFIFEQNKKIENKYDYPITIVYIHEYFYLKILKEHRFGILEESFDDLLTLVNNKYLNINFDLFNKNSNASDFFNEYNRLSEIVKNDIDKSYDCNLFVGKILVEFKHILSTNKHTKNSINLIENALSISFINDYMDSISKFWTTTMSSSDILSLDQYKILIDFIKIYLKDEDNYINEDISILRNENE